MKIENKKASVYRKPGVAGLIWKGGIRRTRSPHVLITESNMKLNFIPKQGYRVIVHKVVQCVIFCATNANIISNML